MKPVKQTSPVAKRLGTARVRCIVEGPTAIQGEVLFSSSPIAFLQGVDPDKGVINDKKHEIYNKPIKDKILVFPNTVGSSVGAYVIYRLRENQVAPKAMINQASDIITASGCALSAIPLYDLLENKITELSNTKEIEIQNNSEIIKRS